MSDKDLTERGEGLEKDTVTDDQYDKDYPTAPIDLLTGPSPRTPIKQGVVFSDGEVNSVYDSRPINARDFMRASTATINTSIA